MSRPPFSGHVPSSFGGMQPVPKPFVPPRPVMSGIARASRVAAKRTAAADRDTSNLRMKTSYWEAEDECCRTAVPGRDQEGAFVWNVRDSRGTGVHGASSLFLQATWNSQVRAEDRRCLTIRSTPAGRL